MDRSYFVGVNVRDPAYSYQRSAFSDRECKQWQKKSFLISTATPLITDSITDHHTKLLLVFIAIELRGRSYFAGVNLQYIDDRVQRANRRISPSEN